MGGGSLVADMPEAINDTDTLASLVQPAILARQGLLVPNRVTVDLSTDHTGDEVYRVYLVFPDDTPDKALPWEKVKRTVSWVRNQIRKANREQRWPYVRVMRESQLLPAPF